MGTVEINPELQNDFSSTITPLDPEQFRKQGYKIIDFLADYYQNIETFPVQSQVKPGYLTSRLPDSAPYNPEPIETILQDLQKDIIPGLTHWQSPNYFALFPCSLSTAGFLGEALGTGFGIVGFNWISSPAATELENVVIDWFGKMLNLPNSFLFSGGGGGVLQGTTCEAMLSVLTAARDQMLRKIGRVNIEKLVVYVSDQTHFSLQKSAQICGINPENIRVISTSKETQFSFPPNSLRSAIVEDIEAGFIPLLICATIGTTPTTAVDPLNPICEIAKEFGIWVHVDAAYGGSACICPEFQHFLEGIEGANSFSLNAHKWFFSTLDCCCLWVKDPNALIKALSTSPVCLKNRATESKLVVDYKDWQITLSRRFRALKLWLVLRSYGVENLRRFIRNHVNLAKYFEGLVAMDKRFEMMAIRNFSVVCFRISPLAIMKSENLSRNEGEEEVNEINKKLVESINGDGQICMSHAMIGGDFILRFAVGASLTDYRHVDIAWEVIKDHANSLLNAS
ncbi:hypothetical protein M9H77_11383 [Catharanthus roseus]|uniref:Uncharacterized protein n=1 Tax=Catharanthus roseus TaxID=4058 RepID=A0ACC0BEG6_CATRO|nr:hypothetical protein M9H77_11383 [Catharanthus roseus]